MMPRDTLSDWHRAGFVVKNGRAIRKESAGAGGAEPSAAAGCQRHGPASPARLAKRKPKMTRCEEWFYEILSQRFVGATIIPQFRVRVSEWGAPVPVHYCVDFAVWEQNAHWSGWWKCAFWEIKDKRRKYHSMELTKPKLLKAANPWVAEVHLAEWDGTTWLERRLS